jgi:hypothetical protein
MDEDDEVQLSPRGVRPKLMTKPVRKIWKDQVQVPKDCSPLDYMLALIRDPKIDPVRRDKMARAAAPFLHKRYDEEKQKLGKKEVREIAASMAGKNTEWGDSLELPDSFGHKN